MSVPVNLPDDLAAQIDRMAQDRTTFVAEAVRRLLLESGTQPAEDETARINELADELNVEAEDVLEYQL
jgi:metal-responsive CopG/Arc/MetJ family transcriptional regulator